MSGPLRTGTTSSGFAIVLAIIWTVAIVGSWCVMLNYSLAPGDSHEVPNSWPVDLPPIGSRTSVLLLAHPHCPCTQASLVELERVWSRHASPAATVCVWIVVPEGCSPDWWRGDVWRRAQRIPGCQTQIDFDGRGARKLGVETSGHVLVFAADGRRLFSGGITAARGHVGENTGAAGLAACLMGNSPTVDVSPIYGCPLFEDTASQ